MSYKVLLIDDRHNDASLEAIKKMAKMANIELVGIKYHSEGMELLQKDSSFEFQAVILDAFGFKKSDTDEDKMTNSGLYYSLKTLSELKSSRIIPWFVYTGHPKNLSDEDFLEKISVYQEDYKFGRPELCYYTKTLHEKELLQDIKTEIDNLENSQIQLQHKHIFLIAKKINIPNEDITILVDVLKSIQSVENNLEPSLYFTQLRKYVEYVFRDAAKLNILHEKCIDNKGQVNLTESSLFLAGETTRHLKVKCAKIHFPKIIADNVKNLIFITGAASHTSEVDPAKNIDYQSYREIIKTPYLLYQLTFIVFDLLVWYDNYIKDNSDSSINKSYWTESDENQTSLNDNEWIDGTVIRIAENGWGTFKPDNGSISIGIHPIAVVKENIKEESRLRVRTELSPDKTKLHIKEIIKLD
jgi:hypothetical protein